MFHKTEMLSYFLSDITIQKIVSSWRNISIYGNYQSMNVSNTKTGAKPILCQANLTPINIFYNYNTYDIWRVPEDV